MDYKIIQKRWNNLTEKTLCAIFEHLTQIELNIDQTFKLGRKINIYTPKEDIENTEPGSFIMLLIGGTIYSQWFYYKSLDGHKSFINVYNSGNSAININLDNILPTDLEDFHCTVINCNS